MRTIALALLLATGLGTWATASDGNWSEVVGGIRGRLAIAFDQDVVGSEMAVVYLELQNVSDSAGSKEVLLNEWIRQFTWQLTDEKSAPVRQGFVAADIMEEGPHWIALPFDSTLRFRVSVSGYGIKPNGGVALQLPGAFWQVPRDQAKTYYLGAVFSSTPDKTDGHNAWRGTLALPKILVPQKNALPDRYSRYPTQWWAPVSKDGAPAWEIFPQEAGPGEVILSKRNELGLLSNFAPTPFTFHGKRYASLEGFWQAMKYPEGEDDPRANFPGLTWAFTRAQVEQLTAFEANKAGALGEDNMKKIGIGWVTFEGKRFDYRPKEPGEHYRIIVAAMREKLAQNPEVKRILLATGDLVLKPDHHQEPDAPAAWRYFEIWMQLRTELQRAEKK